MGFWGALEETVVDGAAGAVGMVPGVGEVAAPAIHGVDAAAHGVAAGYDALTGDDEGAKNQGAIAATQGVEAAAAAVPALDKAAAGADLVMAGYSGAAAATGGEGDYQHSVINPLINAATGAGLETETPVGGGSAPRCW
jgi:hypothetical protein